MANQAIQALEWDQLNRLWQQAAARYQPFQPMVDEMPAPRGEPEW